MRSRHCPLRVAEYVRVDCLKRAALSDLGSWGQEMVMNDDCQAQRGEGGCADGYTFSEGMQTSDWTLLGQVLSFDGGLPCVYLQESCVSQHSAVFARLL